MAHERLAQEVVAEEPGYFYIYLSNDSNTGSEAFFDDFTIMTSESYIVQQIDYYPYGMVAREFRRLGDKATNDLFQEDRALRNSPVDCFSEGPACREGMKTLHSGMISMRDNTMQLWEDGLGWTRRTSLLHLIPEWGTTR